jgi:hypothetical protein
LKDQQEPLPEASFLVIESAAQIGDDEIDWFSSLGFDGSLLSLQVLLLVMRRYPNITNGESFYCFWDCPIAPMVARRPFWLGHLALALPPPEGLWMYSKVEGHLLNCQ